MEPKQNTQMLGVSNCYNSSADACGLNYSAPAEFGDGDTMGKHASLDCVRNELHSSVQEMEGKIGEEVVTEETAPETKMTGKRVRSSASSQEQGGKIPRQCGTGPSAFIPNSEVCSFYFRPSKKNKYKQTFQFPQRIQGVENGTDEQGSPVCVTLDVPKARVTREAVTSLCRSAPEMEEAAIHID
nr:uncharacterized protein LOC129258681 [Lytechinus pictus]